MKIKTSVQVEADITKRLAELQYRKAVLSDALNFHEQHSIDCKYSPEAYEQHRVFAGGLRVALDIMEGGRNFDLYKTNEKVRKESQC